MAPIPIRDKFAKAKIEEPNLNLRLPKEFLKSDADSTKDASYLKIFGFQKNFADFSRDFCCDNTRKAQQVTETVDSGEKLDRKLCRIRNKELVAVFGDDFEGLKEIQEDSKTTIGILATNESNLLKHSFLDFVGTVDQIQHAEELILDEILKTNNSQIFPVILMPPIVYGDNINIPLNKVDRLLGNYRNNLSWIEMETGAWIKIEPGHSSLGSKWRVLNVFGPSEYINKAKLLIESVIKDGEYSGEPGKRKRAEKGGSGVPEKEEEEEEMDVEEASEDVGPAILASGCYGSDLLCGSHA